MSVKSKIILLSILTVFSFGFGYYVGSGNQMAIPNQQELYADTKQQITQTFRETVAYRSCMEMVDAFEGMMPEMPDISPDLENIKGIDVFKPRNMTGYCDKYLEEAK